MPGESSFSKAAKASEAASGGKLSPDIIDQRNTPKEVIKYPHLHEGYKNLIGDDLEKLKDITSAAGEFVKSRFIDKEDSILEDWERVGKIRANARAQRDLGGPRTPPYKGGK